MATVRNWAEIVAGEIETENFERMPRQSVRRWDDESE